MIFIHDNETLGQLTILDVFVHFDGPLLFVAENAAGQRYLVNCIDAGDKTETWLAAAVSDRRLFAMKDGTFSVRNAYSKPELGRVYEVVVTRSGELLSVTSRNPQELRNDQLPDAEIVMTLENTAAEQVNAEVLARQLNSSVVLLRLYSNKKAEAPAKSVGNILSSFETYISTKLNKVLAPPFVAAAAQAPPSFQVNIVGTFPGSFGLEIAVRGSDARIGSTLRYAVEDLNSADELEEFRERMVGVEDDEVEAMRRFMGQVAMAGSDLSLETASETDSEPHFARVPLPRVRAAVKTLKREPKVGTETRTLVGQLIGLNLRTRRFELEDVETEERITGSMAAPIFSDLEKAQLPSRYRVALEGDLRPPKRGAPPTVSNWRMVSATQLR